MNQEKIVPLEQGFATAFIDHHISSNLAYRPQFVSNNYKEGRKVISSIEDELLLCEEFAISVAFITMGELRKRSQRSLSSYEILSIHYLELSRKV